MDSPFVENPYPYTAVRTSYWWNHMERGTPLPPFCYELEAQRAELEARMASKDQPPPVEEKK